MIENRIKQKILEKAISLLPLGIRDLAWKKEDAMNLIKSLINDEIGILGGDVYMVDKNKLIPLCDNWYCNPEANEGLVEYLLRSKLESLKYIKKYPEVGVENILFSFVFSQDID